MNLLFSLPEALIKKVFEYDDTYRIFHTGVFKKELLDAWLRSLTSALKEEVEWIMLEKLDTNELWFNEFVYCCENDMYITNQTVFESLYDIQVYIHPPKDGVLYFKILPKHSKQFKHKQFLQKPSYFDGFLCHENSNFSDADILKLDLRHQLNFTNIDNKHVSFTVALA